MNYGISSSYFCKDFQFDRPTVFRRAKACGFSYVQLPITDAYGDFTDGDWLRIRDEADEAGIGLFYGMALSPGRDVSSEDAQVRRNGMDFVRKVLRGVKLTGAAGVGGINYTVWGGFQPPIHKSERRKHSVHSVRELGKYAEDLGLIYGLEIVNRNENFLLNTAAEARAYCEEVGVNSVRIVLDIYHMNIEEDSIPDAIRTAGDMLLNVHICENNRKMPLGRNAVVDWKGIARAFRDIGFDGYLTFEPFANPYGDRAIGSRIWRELAEDLSDEGLDRDAAAGLAYIQGLMNP